MIDERPLAAAWVRLELAPIRNRTTMFENEADEMEEKRETVETRHLRARAGR